MKKLMITGLIFFITNMAVCQQHNNDVDVQDSVGISQVTPKPKDITGSFEMNYQRHYLWRGLLFGNNDVAQPVLELSYKNFTLGLAQNFNYIPKNVPKEIYTRDAFFDEQDIEITYSRTWKKITNEVSVLAYFYFYQLGTPNTAELSNLTTYNFYKGFSFFTENSVDIANYRGALYSSNGFLFEHKTKNNVVVEWTAFASFANATFNGIYAGTQKSGLNLLGSHIDITKELGKYFIKVSAEKNRYMHAHVKEYTGVNGSGNFALAAGFNF